MSQIALLEQVVAELESAAIPYMVVGSLASSYHGEPRMTRDIDIVLHPNSTTLDRLVSRFLVAGLYVDPQTARDALAHHGSFNVIDPESGWKVDFMMRKDRAFSRMELDRSVRGRLSDVEANVATAEDTIIAKLEWAMQGASDRQLRDVAAVVAVNAETLDYEYISRWIAELGLSEAWNSVKPT